MGLFTKNPYSKKYLLKHPWEIFLHLKRDIKCAWQRVNKGYCFRDLYNIDNWFLEIMPNMLEDFKSNLTGYPSDMTEDDWNDYLSDMIQAFREANPETCSIKNDIKYDCHIEWKETENQCKTIEIVYPTKEDEEKAKQSYEKDKKITEYREQQQKKALTMFCDRLSSLWD